ncbi:uncharacterized protein LOC116247023 [Nymphaea colorata]|nr:uncharacterized protein LOC116247023 [Nymphaea colorata]
MAATAAAVTVFPCINGHQPRLGLLRHRLPAGKPSSISTRFHCHGSRARRLFPLAAKSRREPTQAGVEEKDEPEFSLLTAMTTPHNEIVILDTTDSRILLLDPSHNIHSIYMKETKWTGSYWDEFASLPAIVPSGPIAMLGLGGGTAAHLMLDLWPSLELDGWEIDEILIDKAREYLGLSILEKRNDAGGVLRVHVGDALSPDVAVPGGFAGIVVDLFADGEVLPQLEEVSTWMQLGKKLMSNGRIMVNCGGTLDEDCSLGKRMDHVHVSSHGILGKNPTMEAMREAFSEVNWKKMEQGESLNFLALTGPLPDVDQWAQAVPEKLSSNVRQWKPCSSL